MMKLYKTLGNWVVSLDFPKSTSIVERNIILTGVQEVNQYTQTGVPIEKGPTAKAAGIHN
jgi:hypothetical protein